METAIAVWLGGPILEQATLEAIEQTLLESNEFQRYDNDQVELLTKRIILKLGKQRREEKKVHAFMLLSQKTKNNKLGKHYNQSISVDSTIIIQNKFNRE